MDSWKQSNIQLKLWIIIGNKLGMKLEYTDPIKCNNGTNKY